MDFYEYACGGWIASNDIPDDKARFGTFSQLFDNNQKLLRRLVDNFADSDKRSVKKAVEFYRSCMDVETIENQGKLPITFLHTSPPPFFSFPRYFPIFNDFFNTLFVLRRCKTNRACYQSSHISRK